MEMARASSALIILVAALLTGDGKIAGGCDDFD